MSDGKPPKVTIELTLEEAQEVICRLMVSVNHVDLLSQSLVTGLRDSALDKIKAAHDKAFEDFYDETGPDTYYKS